MSCEYVFTTDGDVMTDADGDPIVRDADSGTYFAYVGGELYTPSGFGAADDGNGWTPSPAERAQAILDYINADEELGEFMRGPQDDEGDLVLAEAPPEPPPEPTTIDEAMDAMMDDVAAAKEAD